MYDQTPDIMQKSFKVSKLKLKICVQSVPHPDSIVGTALWWVPGYAADVDDCPTYIVVFMNLHYLLSSAVHTPCFVSYPCLVASQPCRAAFTNAPPSRQVHSVTVAPTNYKELITIERTHPCWLDKSCNPIILAHSS